MSGDQSRRAGGAHRDPDIVTEIEDAEYVSQRICKDPAYPEIDRPRAQDLDGVSVIRGVTTPEQAYRIVRKGGTPTSDDGVRVARVADLRAAGFIVEHRPNRRNPRHATVRYPGTWDDDVALLFKTCFPAHYWHQESDHE